MKFFLTTLALLSTAQVIRSCPSCTGVSDCSSIVELIELIKCKMPGKDSELYAEPTATFLDDWEAVVGYMMEGDCDNGISIPSSLSAHSFQAQSFFDDSSSTNKTYCVLASFTDDNDDGVVDSPYGTVVINQTPDLLLKDISVDIPHALNDANTAEQGITVFAGTDARSYVLTGAHRYSNNVASCQTSYSYEVADAAHHDKHAFTAAIMAISNYYESRDMDYTAIQFHGMGSSSCTDDDIFITAGTGMIPTQEGEKIDLLRDAFVASAANLGLAHKNVSLPGETTCNLSGGSNTAGRYINGVRKDWICNTGSSGYNGKFIHIEQKWGIRNTADFHDTWIDAINTVDFSNPTPPRGVTISDVNGGHPISVGQQNVAFLWDTQGVDPTEHVKISIHLNDEAKTWWRLVVDSTPNTGSYLWPEVSSSVDPGMDLLVRVRVVSNTHMVDYKPTTILFPLEIIHPNGGEHFEQGSVMNFQWNAPGITNVKLSLHNQDGTNYYTTIRNSIAASIGSYGWTIPEDVDNGADYKVRVRVTNEIGVKRFSEASFEIGPSRRRMLRSND